MKPGIAILNQSTLLSDSYWQHAIAVAVAEIEKEGGFASQWSRVPCPPVYFGHISEPPPDMAWIKLLDEEPNPGALGDHENAGVPFGFVGVGTCIADRENPSAVADHEWKELANDPFVNVWVDDGMGQQWAFEMCDWIQQSTYEKDGVTLSNHLLPAAFNSRATQGPYDALGILNAPFTVADGGYAIVRTRNGIVSQLGASKPCAWKRSGRRRLSASRIAATNVKA